MAAVANLRRPDLFALRGEQDYRRLEREVLGGQRRPASVRHMTSMRSFYGSGREAAGMIILMSHVPTVNSRTLTVVLSESDWRALREVEPDAVGWLHERIRERLGSRASDVKPAGRPPAGVALSGWDDDQY